VDEEKAWRFIQDVSAGLHYLHSCNPPIIHQDIKPDNILIDRSGRFVITDFGISTRVRNTLRRSGTSQYTSGAGTLAYMAPERFGTDPNPVNASDVYSLGATVFELLMGVPPFGEDGGLLQKKGADIPEIKGDYSPELKNVIYLCLAKDTWDRPTAFELSTNPKSIPEKRIMYPPVVPIVYPPVKSPEPGPKVPLWLIVGLSVLVLTVAAFFIANKFSGDLKQSKALSRQYYDNYIHQGDSLNDADRKEDGNYERSYVDALKKYQLALETAKDLGDSMLTSIAQEKIDEMLSRQYNYYILQGDSLNDVGRKEDTNYERSYVDALKKYQLALKTAKDLRDDLLTGNAQEKIDGMKTVILTAYEEFLSKVEKMKEYNELQAADAFLKRANSLKDFIDEEHLENN
jgi:serine/threonine protein kinase